MGTCPVQRLVLILLLVLPATVWGTDSFINVKDYGAVGNGIHIDSPSILNAVKANPNSTIRFPAGTYLIDNSGGYMSFSKFNGTLFFDPNATLVCNSVLRGCLELAGGSGARILNVRIVYSTQPTTRTSEYAIHLLQTTDTIVDGAVVEMSPSAGILSDQAIRPTVTRATIGPVPAFHTLADGIHFANCQDPKVSDSTVINSGDDGIAFVNYANGPNNSGGLASNVVVRNSATRGITVVGQSDVIVSNFLVDTTVDAGILCTQDTSYNTAIPDQVIFRNGIIKNSGSIGAYFESAKSCEFSGLEVYGSKGYSVGGENPGGKVILSNIYTNGGASGFTMTHTATAILNNLTVEATPGYGFYINTGGGIALADNLRAINVAQTDPASFHRAIWFEGNATFRSHALTVIDNQPVATGYIVGEYGTTSSGVATGIQASISNGALTIISTSPHVRLSTELNP
jgi:hypothetical protein